MSRERLGLRAGPLTAVFGDGDLRHIRLGTREILDRIYVGVRDPNWHTIPGRIEDLTISGDAGSFAISFDSIHQEGEIDFRWRASIRGDASGKITFAMDGEAGGTFLSNRISLCILHPAAGCAGRPCTIEKSDGGIEETMFPDLIAPHQPFVNVRAITHDVSAGVRAEVRFAGDVFETEDQRNWSDESYKTYAPPLAAPFPVKWKPGDRILQSVSVRLIEETSLELTGAPALPLPELGLCLRHDGGRLSEREAQRLRDLHLSHLRAELTSEESAAAACEAAAGIGVPLEAVIGYPWPVEDLRRYSPRVKRWLVLDEESKATSERALAGARAALGPSAVLVAGTDSHFVELNRDRLPGLKFDGVCYSVYPQVHASDDETVMANTSTQRDVVRTAGSFLGQTPIFVTPVTLARRYEPDLRQKTGFCAAWTVASLKYLAESGVAGATYFETHGPRGIQDGDEVYPVCRVFEWLADFAGGQVLPCVTTDAKVEGLVLAAGRRRRVLLANLTGEPQTIRARFAAERRITLAPYSVERIDYQASA